MAWLMQQPIRHLLLADDIVAIMYIFHCNVSGLCALFAFIIIKVLINTQWFSISLLT